MSLVDLSSLPEAAEAWVFPGQGAQKQGMSLDFAAQYPVIQDLWNEADATLGRPLSKLVREGSADDLQQTVNTQPAIFVASLAALKASELAGSLRRPSCVAGHSVGEYAAIVACDSLSFADGLRLVAERARLIQKASEENPGTLAALLGADRQQADELCAATGCEVCNLNAPGQVVIGGSLEQVAEATRRAREFGIKRALPLKVGGPFHTSLMKSAADGLREFLKGMDFADSEVPLVANGSARPVQMASEVQAELIYQPDHPVLWEDSVRAMIRGGVGRFVEFGPGMVLSGTIKRIDDGVEVANVETLADLPQRVET
ncbi:MAG: ACP S-malonyltransferase [Dehalococcoidia bacterium]